jgi:peptidoglycan lytic transglycosylase G
MRRFALLLALASAALAATAATAAPEPVLRIVFPEGYSVRQMADQAAHVRQIAIEKRNVTPRLSGSAYAAAAARATPPRSFARYLKRRSVEGFLFPAGYEFLPSTTAASLIGRQIAAFEQRWRTIDLRPALARKRTPYYVLTIASLVEREAAVASERALISAVIHNRLDQGMPLAIDASLRYGLGVEGTRPLTVRHLRSNSPYNTHRFPGLPPTPITNPGLPSMQSAAQPARVAYLFYLRRPNSLRHFFTASEEEFCAKALEYGYKGC